MKKMRYLFLLTFLALFGLGKVYAACTTEENNQIRSEAVQVKISYEEKKRVLDPEEYGMPDGTPDDADIEIDIDYFEVIINNLTENLYITVYNDVTGTSKTYNYSDSDNGTIVFDWEDISEIVKLTVTVYSSSTTNCADTQIYQTDLKLPRYNNYYLDEVCTDASDFYLCQKYLTVDQMDYETFINSVTAYKDGEIDNNGSENNIEDKKDEEEKKSYTIIIVACVIVVIVGVGTVIIVKKQRRNKNEKI